MKTTAITTDKFIERAIKIHGDSYTYDLTNFENTRSKINIYCKKHYHTFQQTVSNHLCGKGCQKCGIEKASKSRLKTTKQFIKDAVAIHGEAYDYSLLEYIGTHTEVEILCKHHNSYFKQLPSNHLQGKGCPICGRLLQLKSRKITTEEFIEKAVDVHGKKYSYHLVNYVNATTKVKITCKAHNDSFEQTPNKHLMGRGCPKCKAHNSFIINNKPYDKFIEECKKIHGDKYDYSLTNYINCKNKIDILCPIHLKFSQKAGNHQRGDGCPKCASIEKGAGFSRSSYINRANDKICTFYTLRCFNENEEFYKIGRTMNNIEVRYQASTAMPYEYEVISEVKGSAGFIWDLELSEKRKLKGFHYMPKIPFAGSMTECFINYKL
jgi:Zn finger protein HypA/HybF involved in hydrogenase expression